MKKICAAILIGGMLSIGFFHAESIYAYLVSAEHTFDGDVHVGMSSQLSHTVYGTCSISACDKGKMTFVSAELTHTDKETGESSTQHLYSIGRYGSIVIFTPSQEEEGQEISLLGEHCIALEEFIYEESTGSSK